MTELPTNAKLLSTADARATTIDSKRKKNVSRSVRSSEVIVGVLTQFKDHLLAGRQTFTIHKPNEFFILREHRMKATV